MARATGRGVIVCRPFPVIGASMQSSEILGYCAATATTVSFIPQAIKVIKTRDTKSISLWMYVLFCFGLLLWLVYGVMLSAVPIILANSVTVLFAGIVLGYKLLESRPS
jgi:MtN3 and saliva related transmembrane protein